MKARTIRYIKNAMLIVRDGSCKSVDACRDCVVHGPLRYTEPSFKTYTCRAKLLGGIYGMTPYDAYDAADAAAHAARAVAVNIANGYLKQFSDTDILEAVL